jgi:hypothetical protein
MNRRIQDVLGERLYEQVADYARFHTGGDVDEMVRQCVMKEVDPDRWQREESSRVDSMSVQRRKALQGVQ